MNHLFSRRFTWNVKPIKILSATILFSALIIFWCHLVQKTSSFAWLISDLFLRLIFSCRKIMRNLSPCVIIYKYHSKYNRIIGITYVKKRLSVAVDSRYINQLFPYCRLKRGRGHSEYLPRLTKIVTLCPKTQDKITTCIFYFFTKKYFMGTH